MQCEHAVVIISHLQHTDVSVVMEETQYTCSETNTACEVSVLLLAPEGGIACDVIATLAAVNGTKAGRLVCMVTPSDDTVYYSSSPLVLKS